MTLISVKHDYLWSVAYLFGFIFVQRSDNDYFSFYMNRLGKREMIRRGIPYREDERCVS